MKRVFAFTALFLALVVTTVWAESGRESKQLPPQEVKIKYATEEYGFRVKDINGVTRFQVLPDGGFAVNNSSGQTVFAISGSGDQGAYYLIDKPVVLTYAPGIGFQVSGTTKAVIYEINASLVPNSYTSCPIGPAAAGVTVVVGAPTAATHGRIIGIRNIAGTTVPYIYAGGLPVMTTSGTTRAVGEDLGDFTWIQQSYNTGISVYILTEFKQD